MKLCMYNTHNYLILKYNVVDGIYSLPYLDIMEYGTVGWYLDMRGILYENTYIPDYRLIEL